MKNLKDKVLCSFEKGVEHLVFLLPPWLNLSTVDYIMNLTLDNQVSTYSKTSLTTLNNVILLIEWLYTFSTSFVRHFQHTPHLINFLAHINHHYLTWIQITTPFYVEILMQINLPLHFINNIYSTISIIARSNPQDVHICCRASSSTTLQSYYLKYEDLDIQHILHIGSSNV